MKSVFRKIMFLLQAGEFVAYNGEEGIMLTSSCHVLKNCIDFSFYGDGETRMNSSLISLLRAVREP